MKFLKKTCIILGIVLVLLVVLDVIKNIYYTIEIKNEINLSEEEKGIVNEKELIADIKSYMFYGSFNLKYAKMPNYSDLENATIPVYGGIDYGNGYSVNKNTGKFYISTNEKNIEHRLLYSAKSFSNLNRIIHLCMAVILIIEIILLIILIIKNNQSRKKYIPKR